MADRKRALCSHPFREVYCQQVEQAMGEGYSLTAFAGLIGVSRALVDSWVAAHPSFAEAVGRGQARRVSHWERAALEAAARGGAGSASVILFGLKTLGGPDWASDHEADARREPYTPVVVFALPENGRT